MTAEQLMNLTTEEKLDYISKQKVEEPKLCRLDSKECESCT